MQLIGLADVSNLAVNHEHIDASLTPDASGSMHSAFGRSPLAYQPEAVPMELPLSGHVETVGQFRLRRNI
jgi:hypothetical protein